MAGFDPHFTQLPQYLPLLPLSDVLLLPKGKISLTISEDAHIKMIDDALKTKNRLVMVTQSRENHTASQSDDSNIATDDDEAFYPIGCAGRIVKFSETLDCRYHVSLRGLYRCHLLKRIDDRDSYPMAHVNFMPYHHDAHVMEITRASREMLVVLVKRYFQEHQINFDPELLTTLHDEVLVTSLAMVCPFSSAEKQALLEACDLPQRADTLIHALMMNLGGSGSQEQLVLQ